MIALLFALVGAVHAAVPVDAGVKVLVRVLSYDRALPQRLDDDLRLGVVFDPTDPLSAAQAAAVREALDALAVTTTVGGVALGRPEMLGSRPLDWATDDEAAARVAGLAGLVVCRGVEDLLPDVLRVASDQALATLTLEEELVAAGVAVGVTQQQARLQILVNLDASKAQGLALSAQLLQLARMVP